MAAIGLLGKAVVSWPLLTFGNAGLVGVALISSASAAILCVSAHFVCAYGSICLSPCSSSRLGTSITLRAPLKPSQGKNWHSVAAQQVVVGLKFIALN